MHFPIILQSLLKPKKSLLRRNQNLKKDEESKQKLRKSLDIYQNIQIYGPNIVVEGQKYLMTESCLFLVNHLLKLKKCVEVLGDIDDQFNLKVGDVVKVNLLKTKQYLNKILDSRLRI